MSDENFLPAAFPRQLCQREHSYGGVLPRGLRQVTTPMHGKDQADLTLNDYFQQNSLRPHPQTDVFIFSLRQFEHLGEDDDGEISSWRDPGEGGSLRGRGQDGRRSFHLLLIQVGSGSTHWSQFQTALHCQIHCKTVYYLLHRGGNAMRNSYRSICWLQIIISYLHWTFYIIQGSSSFRKTCKSW